MHDLKHGYKHIASINIVTALTSPQAPSQQIIWLFKWSCKQHNSNWLLEIGYTHQDTPTLVQFFYNDFEFIFCLLSALKLSQRFPLDAAYDVI